MANNCLITKLKNVVDNNNLLKIGEMIIQFPDLNGTTDKKSLFLQFQTNREVILTTEGGTFVENDLTTPKGTQMTAAADTLSACYVSNNGVKLHISNKYSITRLTFEQSWTRSNVVLDINELKYSENLQFFQAKVFDIVGDLSSFDSKPIINLNTIGSKIEGSIEISLPLASNIQLGGYLVGSLNNSFLTTSPNLSAVYIAGSNITGNISTLLLASKTIGIIETPSQAGVQGSLEDFAQLQWNGEDGRKSGKLTMTVNGTGVTYNGAAVTKNSYVITFSNEGYTIS